MNINFRSLPTSTPLTRREPRGFALLITIVLMAFLVLLMVSFASLTRVEIQIASNNQKAASARQNALLALNIALGQLQRTVGPDQRATVSAEVGKGATGSILPVPANGSIQWTGVIGNTAAYTANTPQPVVLNWLVSGNETTAFQASTAAATLGQITASPQPSGAGSIVYKPDGTLPGLSVPVDAAAAATAANANYTVGSSTYKLLVGYNTVGSAAGVDKYVVAPLVTLKAPLGSVPGLSASATPPIGNYAYWVGDEGVKARINLTDPYAGSGVANEKRWSYLVAQRTGAELISSDVTPPATNPNTLTTSYPAYPAANSTAIPKVLTLQQLSFIGATPTDQTTLDQTRKLRFHEMTTFAKGLEVDSLRGGTRRDLTAAFAITDTAWSSSDMAGQPIFTAPVTGGPDGPTWDQLRSYFRLNLTGSTTVPVQAQTTTTHGIAPVVAGFQIQLGGGTKNGTLGTALAKPTARYFVKPTVVLWNPYNVTLASTTYHLTLTCNRGIGTVGHQGAPYGTGRFYLKGNTGTASAPIWSPAYSDYTKVPSDQGIDLSTITLTVTTSLNPGQSKVFTLAGDTPMTADPITQRGVIPTDLLLTEGWSPGYRYACYFDDTRPFSGPIVGISGTYSGTMLAWQSGAADSYFMTWSVILRQTNSAGAVLQAVTSLKGDMNVDYFQTKPIPPISGQITLQNTQITTHPDPDANIWTRWGWKFRLRFSDAASAYNNPTRWLANYNPRATLSRSSPSEFQQRRGGGGMNSNPCYQANGGDDPTTNYSDNGHMRDFSLQASVQPQILIENASTGDPSTPVGYGWTTGTYDTAPLFAIPTSAEDVATRFLSLGAFRMANLYRADGRVDFDDDWNITGSSNQQYHLQWTASNTNPAYPFGSSLADPRIALDKTFRAYTTLSNVPKVSDYDHSFLLNQALWDSYFLSTISQTAAVAFPLPNSLLSRYGDPADTTVLADLKDSKKVATRLLMDGAFNVNSCSVEAWSALFSSLRNTAVANQAGGNYTALGSGTGKQLTPFARQASPLAGEFNSSSDTERSGSAYTGYRSLTDAQIRSLATNIVAEVRSRGPFLSLAQFINRSLILNDERSLKGALQAAIDATSINAQLCTNVAAKIPAMRPAAGNSGMTYVITGNPYGFTNPSPSSTNPSYYFNLGAPIYDRQLGCLDPGNKEQYAATGAHSTPGFLTQGDVLATLGPVLSARSDTFLIRVYGDVVNPLDSSDVQARAWCEAVVQRVPDFVDQNDAGLSALGNATAPATLNLTNKTFGRRLKIVFFRWLSPTDI